MSGYAKTPQADKCISVGVLTHTQFSLTPTFLHTTTFYILCSVSKTSHSVWKSKVWKQCYWTHCHHTFQAHHMQKALVMSCPHVYLHASK